MNIFVFVLNIKFNFIDFENKIRNEDKLNDHISFLSINENNEVRIHLKNIELDNDFFFKYT